MYLFFFSSTDSMLVSRFHIKHKKINLMNINVMEKSYFIQGI